MSQKAKRSTSASASSSTASSQGPAAGPSNSESLENFASPEMTEETPALTAASEALGSAECPEARRLEESIARLAQRNAWSGVERTFHDLTALNAPISGKTYATAAEAARSTGDMRSYQMRLRQAQAAGADVSEALAGVEATYGSMTITREGKRLRRNEQGPDLEVAVMPFAPDERQAVVRAQQILKETGTFSGLLPAGLEYSVNGRSFTVLRGNNPQVAYTP